MKRRYTKSSSANVKRIKTDPLTRTTKTTSSLPTAEPIKLELSRSLQTTFTHSHWARTSYTLELIECVSRTRVFIGMFLSDRINQFVCKPRRAVILVTPPGTRNTMEDIAQRSIRYQLEETDAENSEIKLRIAKKEPLSALDHPGILLFLFSLGVIREGVQEDHIWTTLTRDTLPLEIEPGHEVIIETDWVWGAVKLFMEEALIEPPEGHQEKLLNFNEEAVCDELQLWCELPQPLSDTAGAWVARKLGPGRFKWGAH